MVGFEPQTEQALRGMETRALTGFHQVIGEQLNRLLGLWGSQLEWTLAGSLPDPAPQEQGT